MVHPAGDQVDLSHLMFPSSKDHMSSEILAVLRHQGMMRRPVEVDPAVCMRNTVDMKFAGNFGIVVYLSVIASVIQGLNSSRVGKGLGDLVQLSTVVGMGTAWDKADAVGVSLWLGTTAPSD
jgi:hypothetical protein